jgi:hypothetical protein
MKVQNKKFWRLNSDRRGRTQSFQYTKSRIANIGNRKDMNKKRIKKEGSLNEGE